MPRPLFRLSPTHAVLVGMALALLTACSSEETLPPDEPALPGADRAPFTGSAPSLQALGESVLVSFSRGDSTVIAGYRLTESQHNDSVFPELPAGRPEVNYPVDLAWQNIELRNGRAVPRQMAWFGGRQVTHRETQCRGGTQEFDSFVVHTDCWVVFEDAEYGVLEAQLFKDALERGGGVKTFRYYDDEPRRVGGS